MSLKGGIVEEQRHRIYKPLSETAKRKVALLFFSLPAGKQIQWNRALNVGTRSWRVLMLSFEFGIVFWKEGVANNRKP